jgi:hypothetical protein
MMALPLGPKVNRPRRLAGISIPAHFRQVHARRDSAEELPGVKVHEQGA